MKKKILFFIHDLKGGGAEKVLVNLVNHMDSSKFDISVISLFGGGTNESHLNSNVRYHSVFKRTFRGNRFFVKYLSPFFLHRFVVKEHFDIEVAYLEGSISKIISGCKDKNTSLVSWIHTDQRNYKGAIHYFRNEKEAINCYSRFDRIVGVSKTVANRFHVNFPSVKEPIVLYNVLETEMIKELANESINENLFLKEEINIAFVGRISKRKGIDRILRIVVRLRKEGYRVHLFAIGVGVDQAESKQFVKDNSAQNYVSFLGYQTNPYKYIKRCDLFVCASLQEGFSTATTEALVVGTPVCTVEVSGMREMLGDNNEYGIITDNDEESLYEGIRKIIGTDGLLDYYTKKAYERGQRFSTDKTIEAIEKMLLDL